MYCHLFTVHSVYIYIYICVCVCVCSGITKGGQGDGPPPVIPSRVVTLERKKFLWLNLQRLVDKRGRTGKKVRGDTLQKGDTRVKLIKVTVLSKKKVAIFSAKIGVTPSVTAPGDTSRSDTTVYMK